MREVLCDHNDHVATITLNRPDKRNALNREVVSLFKEHLDRISSDKTIRVVIIRGKGTVFCSGADLGYLQQLQKFSYEENLKDSESLKELYMKLYSLDKVVVAAVQGYALAGGCGLVSVCDLVVAASDARFGYTEARIGFVPAIVTPFLLRKIGESFSKQLLLTAETISAEQALTMGLVNHVVDGVHLDSTLAGMVDRLVKDNSPESIRMTKEALIRVQEMKWNDALVFAAALNARARGTDDCKRGIAAFLNKEKILW